MKKVTGIFAAVLLCLLVFRLDVAGAAQAIEVDPVSYTHLIYCFQTPVFAFVHI